MRGVRCNAGGHTSTVPYSWYDMAHKSGCCIRPMTGKNNHTVNIVLYQAAVVATSIPHTLPALAQGRCFELLSFVMLMCWPCDTPLDENRIGRYNRVTSLIDAYFFPSTIKSGLPRPDAHHTQSPFGVSPMPEFHGEKRNKMVRSISSRRQKGNAH